MIDEKDKPQQPQQPPPQVPPKPAEPKPSGPDAEPRDDGVPAGGGKPNP